ncbi:MAG: hypothetical protein LIR40_07980 [Bacteroidota bacterium]|nr:hypothetical protein [Bacteroidota bacterium]
MNVTVDADLTITVTEVPKDEVGKIDNAINRFDNYYDCNGLIWIYPEEQSDGSWIINTEWSASCTLPKQETLKEQFENWLKEDC